MQQTSIIEALEQLGRRDLPPRARRSTVLVGASAVLLALGGLSGCSGGGTDGTPYFGREGTTSSTPSSAPASQSPAPPVINNGASSAPTSAPSGGSPGVPSPAPTAPVAAPTRPAPAPAPAANESGSAPTNLAPAAVPPAKPAVPPAAAQNDDEGEDDESGDDQGGEHEGEGEDDDGAPASAGAGAASGAMGTTPPAAPAAAQTLSFERDVWPIFNAQCGPCHVSGRSGGQSIGSTNLDTAFADAVRVGRRITSKLAAGDMPPACNGGNPGDRGCISSSSNVSTITAWLDQGSPR